MISTPVSMVAGMSNGARHGVLLKGGDSVERLAPADTFVVDKTGTLTHGKPEVITIVTLADGFRPDCRHDPAGVRHLHADAVRARA
ncbi:hypothetical protein MHY20_09975 [Helcobacillus sp. ACRRO]|uniref:hypothetical protein n=1 Tax=Helcobacillus sp. ACRRO TaxID=2918202 RepID=UPI001EF71530|nr:hypothetical protein [Helcobacillus sp. ACRRO]MCG7427929.1 hypothetical protein [Helcobacillus sp. ACRRO]